ncbi:unnamed protein product [Sphagnum balticum]
MPPTVGDLGGTYTGVFEFRTFLDPIRILQAGREYRELLGGLAIQADDLEVKLAQILIQLKYRIVKAPPFWTSTEQDSGMSGNIGDMNIIGMVFDAATRAEDMFKEKIEKEKQAALDRTIKAGEALLEKKQGDGNL